MPVEVPEPGRVQWVPVSVARRRLRVSRQRVYQLIESGALAAVRVDGVLMVSSRSIETRISGLSLWED